MSQLLYLQIFVLQFLFAAQAVSIHHLCDIAADSTYGKQHHGIVTTLL